MSAIRVSSSDNMSDVRKGRYRFGMFMQCRINFVNLIAKNLDSISVSRDSSIAEMEGSCLK